MFQLKKMYSAVLLTFGGAALALPALAQQQDKEPVERVTITGSSIKRIASESALPVTTIKAEDFAKQGMTSVEEVLSAVSMNQQTTIGSSSIGFDNGGKSSANLRGLGDGRTLVLLNGRRLPNHPFDGVSVDLGSIPFGALDRIEVLRDGASHIYGTDAVAGVINFITKKQVDRPFVSVESVTPQQSGGQEKRLNVGGGFGDLNKDGFNVFGVVDYHEQAGVRSTDRAFSSTGILPDRGINKTSGTTFPANFFSANGITGNPGFASGCLPPDTIPRAGDGVKNMGTCRQNYSRLVDDIPPTKQTALYGKGTLKLNAENSASFDYLHAESENISRIAPPPMVGLIMHSSSKWYPGGSGGTPAVAGLTGEDLNVSWRPLQSGPRTAKNLGISDRLVLAVEGSVAGWDYNGALNYAQTKVTEDFVGGYVKDAAIQGGVNNGVLNPFALQDATGVAALQAALLTGNALTTKAKNVGADFRVTRDLMALPGGPLGLALGAEWHKEDTSYAVNHATVDQLSISRASALVSVADKDGSRSMSAFYSELNAPLLKSLEIQLAARYDKYSDAGNTFNPKLGIRYQPAKQMLLRGSVSTGFRAPTLYELHSPVFTQTTTGAYNDPVLCPGGVAKAGANPNIVCGAVQLGSYGGNPSLMPEKTKSYSLGIVVEPVPQLTASLDYWRISVKDGIGASLTEADIFANYPKFQDRFHYNASGTALDYVNLSSLANLGANVMRGVDATLQYRFPAASIGAFDMWYNGTYVIRNASQTDRDGEIFENVGVYNGATRYRHNASLRWTLAAWSATLSHQYSSGYVDQNAVADPYKRDVSAYSIWNLSGTYTGYKNLSLTAGIKNLLNTAPPFSNQTLTPQTGYDPRLTSPIGRAFYLRANYTF